MRIIVRCDSCQRQFDAAGKDPGKRFHCRCGGVITVPQPVGHDASVVRCSSCGAPRENFATACVHCSADFTLHERDLHTICPNCLARVSDKARYCHHCAHLLTSQSLSEGTSEHGCPFCEGEQKLASRKLAAELPEVLECSRCAGMWLSLESIEQLIDHESQREAIGRQIADADALVAESVVGQGRAYRPCASCGELMMRRNFGHGASNVIVDLCRRHGIWFDTNELATLLRWIRTGGLPAAQAELARIRGDLGARRPNDQSTSGDQRPSSRNLPPPRNESLADMTILTLLGLFDI